MRSGARRRYLGKCSRRNLEREALDNHHQDLFTIEIANGERRLAELDVMIEHLAFVKNQLLTPFPDFRRGGQRADE